MADSNNETENGQNDVGVLYESAHTAELERADRENPIPGAEPPCPVCGAKTTRLVLEHQSHHTGTSPFRVRLVCSNQECRRWTIYNW
ncbi:MAG: hypothetical protein V3U13_07645 [Gemmatimonadota bacterium]|jgi:hypothetical protein